MKSENKCYFSSINSSLVNTVKRYRTTYKNYISCMLNVFLSKYPFTAELKNGERIVVHNGTEAFFISKGKKSLKYDPTEMLLHLSFKEWDIKFFGAEENGDLFGIYEEELYRYLNVKNKAVIDVGANIGDSSIYFVLMGAKKVISIEPERDAYNAGVKNITLNGVEDRIVFINAALSYKDGITWGEIDKGIGAKFKQSNGGYMFRTVTIDSLIKDYDIKGNDWVLKLDCEGCEYDSLLSTSYESLRSFAEIILEFHNGPFLILKKLESSGFRVYNIKAGNLETRFAPKEKFGLMLAVRG